MKITIYELLGLVKDGKAPKKILLNGIAFEYQGDDYLYKDEDKKEHWLFSTSYTAKYIWLENFLKAEVEIIEEPKKIEKIKSNGGEFYSDYIDTWISKNKTDAYCEFLMNKINELIDVVNELKRDKLCHTK